ncbi:MBL fold metallo-hydrolase [Aliikangiella sp. IMCC44359]|uniref:MBL fold metallo-hydrolase n=1 Tax=Aliikangiella sp. IMCC44359 TaxID=3459125 RepID=UPI00403AA55F
MNRYLIVLLFGVLINSLKAHDLSATSRYIGNEGVLVESANMKVLFDPFFHNNFNIYTLVPPKIRADIFSNQAPYNNIDAIFISHAHEDHFDAKDVRDYLIAYPKVRLFAPQQAINLLKPLSGYEKIKTRLTSVGLQNGDKALDFKSNGLSIDAFRIPHAGWPQRADVENIVFRVSLNNEVTAMHLGDADPNKVHFQPYKQLLNSKQTNIAFPPYWFAFSAEGQNILQKILNAKQVVGVHVPSKVPEALKLSNFDYFSEPGEERKINTEHLHKH